MANEPTNPTEIAAARVELEQNQKAIDALRATVEADPNALPPTGVKMIDATGSGEVNAGAEGVEGVMLETMKEFGFGTVDPTSGVSPEQIFGEVKDILDGKPVDGKIIAEARTKLAALNNDAAWRDKVLSGDRRANHESMLLNLYARIAVAKPPEASA